MKKFTNQISLREWMAIGFGLLFATFIWTVYYVNVTQSSCKGLEQYLKPAFSSYMMVDLDSLAPENPKYSIPEKIEIIRSQQQLVLNREAELINDFRQEMNNNINKMNTWLAFAIGIMSVVGVFIPVILQINLRKEDRNERRGFYRKLLNKSNKLESNIKDNSKKAEAELKDALK
ncbi:MAG: hypothetical protein K2H85_06455, partial [Allobaculum sp.]|nr:hypothetical protein [Allobaculum sp.]